MLSSVQPAGMSPEALLTCFNAPTGLQPVMTVSNVVLIHCLVHNLFPNNNLTF